MAITAAGGAREAIDGADVICTVTGSPTPIVLGDWLTPGQHINAVGTSFPGLRELDGHAVARSRLFVDLREGAIAQAGSYIPGRAGETQYCGPSTVRVNFINK